MKRLGLIAFAAILITTSNAGAQPAATPAPATRSPIEIINEEAAGKDVFRFDYAVPGSPALSLLGLDANKVTQSNSLRPFVLTLPSLLGGNDGDAIALDISPAWLVIPEDQRTASRYTSEHGEWRRRWLRTRTGVAGYEGVEDSANAAKNIGSRLAVGFSTSWLDSSDPLMAHFPGQVGTAWQSCLNRNGEAITRFLRESVSLPIGATAIPEPEHQRALDRLVQLMDERAQLELDLESARSAEDEQEAERLAARIAASLEESITISHRLGRDTAAMQTQLREAYAKTEASKAVAKCAAEADRAARLGADLDLGLGALWRGQPGAISDFNSAGGALWLSYRHPFGLPETVNPANESEMRGLQNWWMVGGAVRAGFDEYVATGNNATPEIRADTLDAWVGLERNSDSQRFSFQIGYQERSPITGSPAGFERERSRYLLSWAQRLGDRDSSVWLNLSYGDAQGHGAFEDDDTLLLSVVFAPPDARKIFGAAP